MNNLFRIWLALLCLSNSTAFAEGVTPQPQANEPVPTLQYKIVEDQTVPIANKNAISNRSKLIPAEHSNYATIKLSPQMRSEGNTNSKYALNLESIAPHLKNSLFYQEKSEYINLPTVVKHVDGNLLAAAGNQFFAKGLAQYPNNIYTILRQKNTYLHPESKENLGTEFMVIGLAKVSERGKDLTRMEILKSSCQIEKGDKLTPRVDLDLPAVLSEKIPDSSVQGYVLAVEEGLWDMGKYNNAIISLGERDGIQQGHILNVYRMNHRKDLLPTKAYKRKRSDKKSEQTEFSATKYGELIVYKVFAKVSLCLVVDAKFPFTVFDVVKSDVVESEECCS